MAKDTLKGDFSSKNMFIEPIYSLMRIPEYELSNQCDAVNRLSADFAQIYFPSRYNSNNAYTNQTNEPWSRPSRYAPLIHILCKYTLCKLPYGYASLINIVLQLFIFYIALYYSFKVLNLKDKLHFAFLLTNILLFLTPVGLTWFERGQFSLYVAVSYLWLFLGIIKSKRYFFVIGAFFSFIKWTSLPFILIILSLYLINSGNFKNLKNNFINIFLFAFIFILLFTINFFEGIDFLKGLINQENTYVPEALSLLLILPKYIVKLLPFVIIFIGSIVMRRNKELITHVPFLLSAGILILTYPTLAFDYNVPCILCFIPLLFLHKKQLTLNLKFITNKDDNDSFFIKAKYYFEINIYIIFFILFTLIASYLGSFTENPELPQYKIIYFYILFTFIIFLTYLIRGKYSQKQFSSTSIKN